MESTVPNTGVKDARTLHATAPSVPITVHPLVLLNIADDASRIVVLNNKKTQGKPNRIPFGVLLGTSGHETSIHTSVDFEAFLNNGKYECNWEMAAKRCELCRTTLQSYDVVGWYTTGTSITPELLIAHTQFLEKKNQLEQANVCTKPLVVIMDDKPAANARNVPVVICESKLNVAGATSADASSSSSATAAKSHATDATLSRVEFQFESEETERIGVQQSGDSSGGATGNWVGPASDRFAGAVASLNRRMLVICDYLKAVKEGKLPPDAELLRRIKQCATKLPRPEDALELRGLLGEGVKDALATTSVALMTKGALGLAQLLEDTQSALEFESRVFK